VNATVTAHQLYPAARRESLSDRRINAIIAFVASDIEEPGVLYDGMDRAETVATAKRSLADLMGELHERAAADYRVHLDVYAGVSVARPAVQDLMTDPVYDA